MSNNSFQVEHRYLELPDSFYSRVQPFYAAGIAEWQGAVRPPNPLKPLNVTFYTNMNFLASRARLRRYTHHAYRVLATRFVEANLRAGRSSHEGYARASARAHRER